MGATVVTEVSSGRFIWGVVSLGYVREADCSGMISFSLIIVTAGISSGFELSSDRL